MPVRHDATNADANTNTSANDDIVYYLRASRLYGYPQTNGEKSKRENEQILTNQTQPVLI